MDSGRIQMCSEPGPELGKSAVDLSSSAYHHGRIMQCSKVLKTDWKGKVDMSEEQDMDCSENCNPVDVSIAAGKLTSNNLRFKLEIGTVEVQPRMINQSISLENDISKRHASRKVFVSAETSDESTTTLDHLLGFLHKRRPQKRAITQITDEHNATCIMDPIKLKATSDLIQQIKAGRAPEKNVCISYSQDFSDISKLETLPGDKVTSGTFGDVLRVKDRQTGKIHIQKKVKKNTAGELEFESNEIEVPLQFPDAPNIASFLGLAWSDKELIFIMEDAGISLRQLITDPKFCTFLNESNGIEKVTLGFFTGISHLAKHGITHWDIKPENVCYNMITGKAQLIDFGSSKTPQNLTNYKGVTPEYLDPLANKGLLDYHSRKTENSLANSFEASVDVWSGGVTSLFMIMKAHPMIKYFTGAAEYPRNFNRMSIIQKIIELKEETIQKLLDVPMSDNMKVFLNGTLTLNRNERWTSKKTVEFLQARLNMVLQPSNKLSKQEPQFYSSEVYGDQSNFVDLRKKNNNIELTQGGRQQAATSAVPESCNIYQCTENEQRLGIAFKEPAMLSKYEGILVPAKFNVTMQQEQIMAVSSIAKPRQLGAILSQQGTGSQLYLRPKMQFNFPDISLEAQEVKDYNDLVESFNVKLIPSISQRNQTVQSDHHFVGPSHKQFEVGPSHKQFEQHILQSSPPRIPQKILPANTYIGQESVCSGFPQDEQFIPNRDYAIQGFSGRLLKVVEERGVGNPPPGGVYKNIPDIDALIQSSDERVRPKIKGVRRSRASQD